jgi:hypothetical protein
MKPIDTFLNQKNVYHANDGIKYHYYCNPNPDYSCYKNPFDDKQIENKFNDGEKII